METLKNIQKEVKEFGCDMTIAQDTITLTFTFPGTTVTFNRNGLGAASLDLALAAEWLPFIKEAVDAEKQKHDKQKKTNKR